MPQTSRSALFLCAAAASIAAVQPWLMLAIGDADVSSLEAMDRNPEVAGRMLLAMLVFMPPMFIAYWIATRSVALLYPTLASFAFYGFALWFALELLPRSFDLLVVHGRWLPKYAAAEVVERIRLEEQFAFYRDGVSALTFVRRHALLIAQAILAICVWRHGIVGRVLAVALGLSVLRLLLGSLALYGGFASLYAIADPMYFVTAGAIFPLLAVFAWKRARGALPA